MARSGEGAKELKPIMSASDVFAKAVPRGQGALPYTHTINICFPHADQPIRGPAPAGMAAQVYDCTPVELQAAGASGSRTQQRLAEINNRSAIMNAINVACAAYRDNQEGDPSTGTPPYARILVRHIPSACTCARAHPPAHEQARACARAPCLASGEDLHAGGRPSPRSQPAYEYSIRSAHSRRASLCL